MHRLLHKRLSEFSAENILEKHDEALQLNNLAFFKKNFFLPSPLPLGESNINLRRNIVERILRIYHLTCRNLTVVNDNLSRAQGTIEVSMCRNDVGLLPGSLVPRPPFNTAEGLGTRLAPRSCRCMWSGAWPQVM